MPEITVLMPVRNGERYIKESIDSVLNQTLTDFEFLIIPQIRNPTKVSERCGPNRQECDFSSLD